MIYYLYGEIMRVNKDDYIYIEYFFSGRKRLFYKGIECFKGESGKYEYKDGDDIQEIEVVGSLLNGVKVVKEDTETILIKSIRWYEYLLTFAYIGFVFYGDNFVLSSLIAAVLGIINLIVMRGIRQVWLKIVAALFVAGLTILIIMLAGIILKALQGD